MTASPVHAPSAAAEGQEAPFAPGPVEELLRLVIKAGRALVFTEAEVHAHDDGKGEPVLVAKLSATMAVVQASSAGKTA